MQSAQVRQAASPSLFPPPSLALLLPSSQSTRAAARRRCAPPRLAASITSSVHQPSRSKHFPMADAHGDLTLLSFASSGGPSVDNDMVILLSHLQAACKQIASLLASPSSVKAALSKQPPASSAASNGRDTPKPLDILSNEIIKTSLQNSNKVAVVASEEEDLPVWFNDNGPYVVVFDPLDGSRNIDASIPTGSIFGIYRRLEETDALPVDEKAQLNVLQRGERLVGAAYSLYSSATVLCISVGSGTHAFTLDRSTGEFVLTHPNLTIPERDALSDDAPRVPSRSPILGKGFYQQMLLSTTVICPWSYPKVTSMQMPGHPLNQPLRYSSHTSNMCCHCPTSRSNTVHWFIPPEDPRSHALPLPST